MQILTEPLRSAWQGKDVYELLHGLDGEVYREKEGRRTFRFELDGQSYFAKVFSGIGWKALVTRILKFRRPVVSAENEWRAIEQLHELGIPTMQLAGYGKRGRSPAKMESFIITKELKPTISLEDYCRDWPDSPPAPALKRAIIHRVAEMTRAMHANGINHRDLYICHFLLDTASPPLDCEGMLTRLYLIDLHRAAQHRKLRNRWRVKDVAGLYFSSMDIGLTRQDRLRFIAAYTERPWREAFRLNRSFWRRVDRRGMAGYREFRRKNPDLFP